jgi:hypothetical protein
MPELEDAGAFDFDVSAGAADFEVSAGASELDFDSGAALDGAAVLGVVELEELELPQPAATSATSTPLNTASRRMTFFVFFSETVIVISGSSCLSLSGSPRGAEYTRQRGEYCDLRPRADLMLPCPTGNRIYASPDSWISWDAC